MPRLHCLSIGFAAALCRPEYHYRRVEIAGFDEPFNVIETSKLEKGSLGGITWPGALALATFLGEHSDLVERQRVVELGCA